MLRLNKVKTELECKQCQRIFEEPVFLPCMCTVCHAHLREASLNTSNGMIECRVCKLAFDVKSFDAKENTHAKLIVEANDHLSDQEKELHTELTSLVDQYQLVYEQLSKDLQRIDKFSEDKFAQIRQQIDLQRQILKSKIDLMASEMLEKTNKTEFYYKEQFRMASVPFSVDTERSRMSDAFRQINLVVDRAEELKKSSHVEVDKMQAKIKGMYIIARENVYYTEQMIRANLK